MHSFIILHTFNTTYNCLRASLVAQTVKNLPAMWKIQVRSLGQEDPEKGMATHSSILAQRVPRTEETGGLVHEAAKSQTRLTD